MEGPGRELAFGGHTEPSGAEEAFRGKINPKKEGGVRRKTKLPLAGAT